MVARAERRLVSNLATGVQFLGRESNSHYHAHKFCLVKADPAFNGTTLVVPAELRGKRNAYQRVYLEGCTLLPVWRCQQEHLVAE